MTKFRYMLLNPADRLAEVVNTARATILVGGTMEPAELLVETLAKGNVNKKIQRFSCNHVIDDDQLLSLVIDKTVDGKPFKLTYETRSNEQVLRSLAISLRVLIPQLPNGVVIFVPSYDFLYMFQKKLKDFGLIDKFQKPIFTESRQPKSDIWDKFSRAAKSEKGAVLMAVVGGKMSEGINFCDELGRAVIVVGLPYPNKNSVELKERMRFLDSQIKNGGNLLYESLCMHAVNQAIGRAIRHRRDYASVFLFDERFKSSKSKLSTWIGQKTQTDLSFQQVLSKTKDFFGAKK
ncbi:unnamed protein product [Caenorhabditis angaria]|uniref:ATP-dependent helicase C-terminal domain-containing protein n=1 Tax=Caenorhabditis angaria TaxID=860376 RepID=A0A9P1N0K8_9PELO|nr:unnamed protein product [Caenorhabditis angaria]